MKILSQAICIIFASFSGQIYANHGYDSIWFFVCALVSAVFGMIVVSWSHSQAQLNTTREKRDEES